MRRQRASLSLRFAMANKTMSGFRLFALALVVFLVIRTNSGANIEHGKTLEPGRRVSSLIDGNEMESERQLVRNRRQLMVGLADALGGISRAVAGASKAVKRSKKGSKGSKAPTTDGSKGDRKGQLESGQKYHQAPKVEQMTGFPDLKKVKQTSNRKRWVDQKTNEIFEWDSKKGELERYTKQGKHKGGFDPYTGEQRSPAQPERRIDI